MHKFKNVKITSLINFPSLSSGSGVFCEFGKLNDLKSYYIIYENNIIPVSFYNKKIFEKEESTLKIKSFCKSLLTSDGISLDFLNNLDWNVMKLEEYELLKLEEEQKEKEKRKIELIEKSKKYSELILKENEDLKSYDKIRDDYYRLREKYKDLCLEYINYKSKSGLYFYDESTMHLSDNVDFESKYFESGSEKEIFCKPYFIEDDIKIYSCKGLFLGSYFVDYEDGDKEIWQKSHSIYKKDKLSLEEELKNKGLKESLRNEILEYIKNQ